jgi:hypothetical protein
MKQPTKLQTELLILTSPKPYGKELKLIQAAKLLHISYSSAKYQMAKFRKQFPERWKTIKELRNLSKTEKLLDRRIRHNLKRPIRIGALDWSDIKNIENDFYFDEENSSKTVYIKIKEKF